MQPSELALVAQGCLFGLLGALAVRGWWRTRSGTDARAAVAFTALAVLAASPLARLLPDRFDAVVLLAWLELLVLFPVLLFEFLTSFDPPRRSVVLGVRALLVVAMVLAPLLPAQHPDAAPTGSWRLYTVLVIVEWTLPVGLGGVRLWTRSRALPLVARRRATTLALGATAIVVALVLAMVSADAPAWLAWLQLTAGVLSALLLVVGHSPPRLLVAAWRGPVLESLHDTLAQLVAVRDGQSAIDLVVPAAAELAGADRARLVRPDGTVLGEVPAEAGDGTEPDVRVPLSDCHLLLWLSPYTRWFGGTDLLTIASLTAALEVARQRTDAHARELRIRDELRHQALHDPLTGLPNRALLTDRLARSTRASRSAGSLGVLFVDLDRFKQVNNALGHHAGDEVLRQVAARLRAAVGPNDTVARFGGDEFVVLLERLLGPFELTTLADRMADDLQQPMHFGGHELVIGASVGARLVPLAAHADEVLREADAAMYAAKQGGGGQAVVFSDGMRPQGPSRLGLELDLRRALARNELQVYFQPVVDLEDGRISGAEALVRWQHPVRGLLGPDEFIALAEETGLVVDIGQAVLRAAVAQLGAWRAQGLALDFTMAVNLSPVQVGRGNLVATVAQTLIEHSVPAGDLVLEITESALAGDVSQATPTLRELSAMGVQLSLDDFGTGYSSLSHLHEFPIDQVKIDRSFVARAGSDSDAVALIEAISALATALDLTVVAEGIEQAEQLSLVRTYCRHGQGWLFDHALPAADWQDLLLRQASRYAVEVAPTGAGAARARLEAVAGHPGAGLAPRAGRVPATVAVASDPATDSPRRAVTPRIPHQQGDQQPH